MKVRQARHLENRDGTFAAAATAAATAAAALFSIKKQVLAGLAYATSCHVKLPKLRPLWNS